MRSQLAAGLVIAARILRQRVRDRSAIVFSVLTPLGLALAFSALIPNDFQSFHTHFVIVDQDRGQYAAHLIEAFATLDKDGIADTEVLADEAKGMEILRAGNAGALIVIPAGFTDAVNSGKPARLVLEGGQYPPSFEVARAVVTSYADDIGGVSLLIATQAGDGAPTPQQIQTAVAANAAPSPITVLGDAPPARQAGRITFYAAAMAVMFVFFATQYGALALAADRQVGTLARLLAAPISPGSILVGAALASLALGLVAMGVLWAATTVIVHASWGSPALVATLIVSAVFAATGMSLLITTLARTPQQATSLNSMVALSMAAVGGVFLPLSQAPAPIVTISQITPHAWFLRGIDVLSDASAGAGDIALPVMVMLGMGAVLGAAGLLRARRALVMA